MTHLTKNLNLLEIFCFSGNFVCKSPQSATWTSAQVTDTSCGLLVLHGWLNHSKSRLIYRSDEQVDADSTSSLRSLPQFVEFSVLYK